MQTLAVFFLVAVAIGGVAWVFVYPMLSGERQAERRKETVAQAPARRPDARRARNAQKSRREQVEGIAQGARERGRKKSVPLHMKIAQAGLNWSKRQYILISVAMGVAAFCRVLPDRRRAVGGARHRASRPASACRCWLLKFLKKRREDEVPGSVSRMRSTPSCAASRPACRCSTACGSSPPKRRSRCAANSAPSWRRRRSACRSAKPARKLYERIPIAGGELLRHRHRDPAEGRRQPVGGARQPLARCCATARR